MQRSSGLEHGPAEQKGLRGVPLLRSSQANESIRLLPHYGESNKMENDMESTL